MRTGIRLHSGPGPLRRRLARHARRASNQPSTAPLPLLPCSLHAAVLPLQLRRHRRRRRAPFLEESALNEQVPPGNLRAVPGVCVWLGGSGGKGGVCAVDRGPGRRGQAGRDERAAQVRQLLQHAQRWLAHCCIQAPIQGTAVQCR